MQSVFQDLRYGLRLLAKSPGFTAIAVVTVALGIGSSTAIFSVVKSALLDPWPYHAADRIVTINPVFPKIGVQSATLWSVPEFKDLRGRTDVFDFVIAGIRRTANLQQHGYPERVVGAAMTADGFSMLGVKPIHGRIFLPSEDLPGASRVVVLSNALWTRRFSGDPGVIGSAIRLDDQLYTIVGVMPPDFVWWGSEFWLPLSPDFRRTERSARAIAVQGKLRPGITVRAAEAALQSSASDMERRFGAQVPEYQGLGIRLVPLREDVLRNVRESLMLLLAAVAFLLLVASANVANLLMARATSRQREIATRIALGADRMRIVRQLLTESVLLAAIGAAVGCALAYVSTGLIVSLIPYGFIPAESHVRLSPGVLLFAIGLAVVTGVLFGLAPARQAFRVDLNDALKQGSSKMVGSLSGRRMRHTLTVGEVALATLALCGAGALVRSFGNLQNQDLGFRPANVLTMRIGLPENHYSPAALTHFFEELLRRTRGVPAIEDVALASDLPLGPILSSAVTIDGASPETLGRVPEADYAAVSPGYFSLLAIPVTRGRAIGNQDSANTVRVAVINQTMAGLYWPNQDPLGKRFTFGPASPQTPWITVIGIARDVRQINVESGPRQAFFIPFSQDPADSRVMSLLVRTKNEQGAVASAIREKIAELDPELPLYQVQLLETRIANSLGGERLAATMLVCFASICFALTMVGLYGVISYSAAQRVHEFGLRMALGASRASIVGIVVTEAGKLAISGIALGCAGAVFLGRVLSSLLYGATPADGPMLAAVSALLVTVAVSASLIPAVRAMRIDPNAALRHE